MLYQKETGELMMCPHTHIYHAMGSDCLSIGEIALVWNNLKKLIIGSSAD